MRLYQSGALLTGARSDLIHRGGVLVDGPRIVAAGPLGTLMAQFSQAELGAVVAEAHRLGKRVAAHAHGRLGITQAVAAQMDTIEHCSFAGPDPQVRPGFRPGRGG